MKKSKKEKVAQTDEYILAWVIRPFICCSYSEENKQRFDANQVIRIRAKELKRYERKGFVLPCAFSPEPLAFMNCAPV